jgi:hypothetical protein
MGKSCVLEKNQDLYVACPSKAKQNKNPKLLFDIKKKDYENTE